MPSHWLAVCEALAALAVLGLAGACALRPASRALGRLAARLSRPRRLLPTLFLLGCGATAASYLVLGPPIPKVTDEYGHLLVADTWLHGRLANPPHPMWRHFDIYALQFPSYASKYPPGQGALLALGGLLGDVAVGPCLGAGLLAAALGWAFTRWLRPRWAFAGAFFALLRLAIGSYWHQSYWGGTVAAIGGALLFGAWAPGRRARPGIAAAGLALLALSRPFEGLVVALPCFAFLLRRWWRGQASRPGRELALIAAILLPTTAFLLYSNWKITGDARLFPQAGYVTAYGSEPDFVFQGRFGAFEGQQQRAPVATATLAAQLPPDPPAPWLGKALLAVPARLAASLFFYLGIAGSLALVLGVARRPGRFALPLAALVLGVLAQGLPTYYFPHHASPLTFPFYLFAFEGLRRAALARWPAGPARGRRPGYGLALLLLVAELAATGLRFPGLRPGPDDPSRQREEMARRLENLPGRHLVIVSPRSQTDWVWNGADIDAQKIVWARTDGPAADAALRAYYAGREAWSVRLDVEPPVLGPWRPAAAASRVYTEKATGMEFVEIAPGSFQMGSPPVEPRREEQELRHRVTLTRPFWIGRTEVTQAQWRRVLGSEPSRFRGDDLPVEQVNHFEIQAFLARLAELSPGDRFRLPTEAEWEYACRAGAGTAFSFGDGLGPGQANVDTDPGSDDGARGTRPVGSYPANAWGLFDFHGNVWEWCADEPCPYPAGDETDPVRACGHPLKVIRGGSWLFGADSARCALRYTHAPKDRGPSLGFRVVREPR